MSFRNKQIGSDFMRQVVASAKSHFGQENVSGAWNDHEMGSFLVNLRPGAERGPLGHLNDLQVNMIRTGEAAMDIHFGYSPLFNQRMFNRIIEVAEQKSAGGVMKIDGTRSTPVSRQLSISEIDVVRLREQAELVVTALQTGIRDPQPEGQDSLRI